MDSQNFMKIKATLELEQNNELYKLIDFLNKNLKTKNLIFGLTQENKKSIVTIYEV